MLLVCSEALHTAPTVEMSKKMVCVATQRKGAAPQWAAFRIPWVTTQLRMHQVATA